MSKESTTDIRNVCNKLTAIQFTFN